MGNLKFKPKKKADIARISAMIKGVNDLVAMSLVTFTKGPEVYIFPEILVGKGDDYNRNFCKNLLTYYRMHSGKSPEETRNTTISIYNKSTDRLIFTYSDQSGLKIN